MKSNIFSLVVVLWYNSLIFFNGRIYAKIPPTFVFFFWGVWEAWWTRRRGKGGVWICQDSPSWNPEILQLCVRKDKCLWFGLSFVNMILGIKTQTFVKLLNPLIPFIRSDRISRHPRNPLSVSWCDFPDIPDITSYQWLIRSSQHLHSGKFR